MQYICIDIHVHVCLCCLTCCVATGEIREYCLNNNNNVFNASCPRGYVIIMEVARYGRMRQGACVTSERELNCYSDELTYMHGLCSGRSECQLTVPDPVMQGRYPCQDRELHSYLEAAYRCQEGKTSQLHSSLEAAYRCQEGKTSQMLF